MLGTTTAVRGLTADDLPSVRALLDRDPGVNVFLRYRVDSTALRDRVVGARIWGYFDGPDLVAACHAGSNIVPAEAGADAVEAFAGHVLTEGIRPASIAGLQSAVLPLWERLAPFLGPARSIRPVQPFLAIDDEPQVAPDPRVRRVIMDELDLLYPACVSMFREEVGIDPEAAGRPWLSRPGDAAHLAGLGVRDHRGRRDPVQDRSWCSVTARVPAPRCVGAARSTR